MTKEEKNLEKRMYFFVPYNLSPIQQAIQAGHAALEYARKYGQDEEFIDFADNWKTWIILNGGTTNKGVRDGVKNLRNTVDPYKGSLDNLYVQIIDWNINNKLFQINSSIFQEPDLNDALTAVCFICDERVFNYTDYPDIRSILLDKLPMDKWLGSFKEGGTTYEEIKNNFPDEYTDWEKSLGGPNNVFLRNLLKGKKLA